VLKYFNRQPQSFAITGLPDSFGEVVAMAVSGNDPNRGSVYVLDKRSGSVLEFTKSGEFVRQYRGNGDEFADGEDLTIDPTSGTLYVVGPSRLYAFKPQP
jgi:uncharacterized protein YjiK